MQKEQGTEWHLFLCAVKQMLPYLHAAAHLAYPKSTHHYVQHLEQLSSEVQYLFEFGYATIHRSDKF